MSLSNELRKASDKIKSLSTEMLDVDKEGFSRTLQRKPMFRDKEEARKYMDDKGQDPSRARVTLIWKQLEETLKDIRWT